MNFNIEGLQDDELKGNTSWPQRSERNSGALPAFC